jgi:hypothetical protein
MAISVERLIYGTNAINAVSRYVFGECSLAKYSFGLSVFAVRTVLVTASHQVLIPCIANLYCRRCAALGRAGAFAECRTPGSARAATTRSLWCASMGCRIAVLAPPAAPPSWTYSARHCDLLIYRHLVEWD